MRTMTTMTTLFSLLLASASFALPIDVTSKLSVTGKVVDQKTYTPMEYVTAVLFSAANSKMIAGTITDKEGFFSLSMLDSGSYYLEISYIGFEKKRISPVMLNKKNRKMDLGEVTLAPVTEEINEVVISGNKSAIEFRVDKRVVNVDKNINAQGGTAINALENAPSVQVDA